MLKVINKIFLGRDELVEGDEELVKQISKEFMSEGPYCPLKIEEGKK